jgi:hypothetical protein
VSLAVEALVVAGGIFLGRLISRVMRRRSAAIAVSTAPAAAGDPAPLEDDALQGFPCQLGDVVLRRVEGDEAWLAGAMVMLEDRAVAALFVAPEARGDRGVYAPGPGETTLMWLAPLPAGELGLASLLAPGGEPPRTLEHAGRRYERARRLPVRVERQGTGAPSVGKRAIVGEYKAAGTDRVLLVLGSDAVAAWRGVALAEGSYEVLPGGKATLEP